MHSYAYMDTNPCELKQMWIKIHSHWEMMIVLVTMCASANEWVNPNACMPALLKSHSAFVQSANLHRNRRYCMNNAIDVHSWIPLHYYLLLHTKRNTAQNFIKECITLFIVFISSIPYRVRSCATAIWNLNFMFKIKFCLRLCYYAVAWSMSYKRQMWFGVDL